MTGETPVPPLPNVISHGLLRLMVAFCYIFPQATVHMELWSPSEFAKEQVLAVQEYSALAGRSIANLFSQPVYSGDIIQQADLIGVGSLPIVALSGLFTGVVLALNSANTLQRF